MKIVLIPLNFIQQNMPADWNTITEQLKQYAEWLTVCSPAQICAHYEQGAR